MELSGKYDECGKNVLEVKPCFVVQVSVSCNGLSQFFLQNTMLSGGVVYPFM